MSNSNCSDFGWMSILEFVMPELSDASGAGCACMRARYKTVTAEMELRWYHSKDPGDKPRGFDRMKILRHDWNVFSIELFAHILRLGNHALVLSTYSARCIGAQLVAAAEEGFGGSEE